MTEPLAPEQQRAMEYLAAKGTRAPVGKLREQLREAFASIERAFDDVALDRRDHSPAPGKWSAHQILNHLVLSHGPAVPQFETLLSGESPADGAVPADLQSAVLPDWATLRERLGAIHRDFLRLIDGAPDDASLEPKAMVEMVIKVDGQARHWYEPLDWKAFIQAIRVHTIEHGQQLQRTLATAV